MNVVQPIRNKRDIDRMKKALHGRNLLLFTFGINSALRVSDLLKLTVGDVRGKEIIRVKETKTKKSKTFRLNKAIIKAVAELVPANTPDDAPLFPSRKGNAAITRQQAYRVLNDAAERAGLSLDIGTHTMRKTMAYHAYKAGVDLTLLMTILNHSSQRETLKYIGITQQSIDEVYINVNL